MTDLESDNNGFGSQAFRRIAIIMPPLMLFAVLVISALGWNATTGVAETNELRACQTKARSPVDSANAAILGQLTTAIGAAGNPDEFKEVTKNSRQLGADLTEALKEYQDRVKQSVEDPEDFLDWCHSN